MLSPVEESREEPAIPWERALRLDERALGGHGARSPGIAAPADAAPPGKGAPDGERAARRLDRWRAQAPFGDPVLFARRLAAAGLDEAEMVRRLGEPEAALRGRLEAPAWAEELAAALAHPAIELPAALRGGDVGPGAPEGRGAGGNVESVGTDGDLLRVFAPLIGHAADELRRAVAGVEGGGARAWDLEGFLGGYVRLLAQQVRVRIARVLAVEMRIESMEGRLAGARSEDRFRSFVEAYATPARRLELLARYPVLGRLLATAVRQWVSFGRQLLSHAAADRVAVAAAFAGGGEVGPLCGIEAQTGDLHGGGQCVVIARFAGGLRAVYKPKPLAADRHFEALLGWLNERGATPPFRLLRVLDRGDHGWQEHVQAAACATAEEVERFYRRIGGLLAVLYLVDATDFHLENLIAAGEHPMLVDLESLFHARAERAFPFQVGPSIEHSVLRSGLLPQRREVAPGAAAPDISGLWGEAGQLSAEALPHWVDAGTDEMRLARDRLRMPGASNRPRLGGVEVDVLDHGPAIVAGFQAIYGLLATHRDELAAPGGPIQAFADDPVRVILRPTTVYAKLLHEGFHPHLLGNALDLDRHFDLLWVPVPEQPLLAEMIGAEQQDLWQGDVPLFTARPGSRDLWDSRGRRIADLWDAPSLHAVLDRVHGLGPAGLARQSWFVRASLATRVANAHRSRLPRYDLDTAAPPATRQELLDAAVQVGRRLEALARRGAGEAGWWALGLLESGWSLGEMEWDLYGGLLGVAFFLAHLASLAEEPAALSFRTLAEEALAAARRMLAREEETPRAGIGAFLGLGGAVYVLCHLARLWQDPGLLAEAERMAALIRPRIEGDQALDLTAGSAGAIATLLVLHEAAPRSAALAVAAACGDRLLTAAEPQAAGVAWRKRPGEPPLGGMAHGAAGIAWALARLGGATGRADFAEAVRQALCYERSLELPGEGTWRDLRRLETSPGQPAGEAAPMWAWCHGAPGIGMARLAARGCLDDPRIEAEVELALGSTRQRGFGMNHSLCHGDLGNLELLLQADHAAGDGRWQPEVARRAGMVLAGIRRRGWLCGVPEGLETPGLMTGLAGIGYGLLRLAEPSRIPAVLVLAGPPADRTVAVAGAAPSHSTSAFSTA